MHGATRDGALVLTEVLSRRRLAGRSRSTLTSLQSPLEANSSSCAFASFRSRVSNPSVNQL